MTMPESAPGNVHASHSDGTPVHGNDTPRRRLRTMVPSHDRPKRAHAGATRPLDRVVPSPLRMRRQPYGVFPEQLGVHRALASAYRWPSRRAADLHRRNADCAQRTAHLSVRSARLHERTACLRRAAGLLTYSARNTCIGSARVARSAGNALAPTAVESEAAVRASNVAVCTGACANGA